MEDLKTTALQSIENQVKFWACYVDDTFCIIKRENLEDFTHLKLHTKLRDLLVKPKDKTDDMGKSRYDLYDKLRGAECKLCWGDKSLLK